MLPNEGEASLRATGWTLNGKWGGGFWDTPSRRQADRHPPAKKLLWEIVDARS